MKKILTLLIITLGISHSAYGEPPATPTGKTPEAPSVLRPVHEVDVERLPDGAIHRTTPQSYQPIRPAIPPVRTSHDGRLGFNWASRRLYLLAPEKISRPFPFSEPGMNILVDGSGVYSQIEGLLTKPSDAGKDGNFEGTTFCNSSSKDNQPRKCYGNSDCYDMTYLAFRTFRSPGNPRNIFDHAYFRSRKVEIQVQNPKTPQASIVNIRANGDISEKIEPIEVDFNLADDSFHSFEPMAVSDGHLYVARASYGPIRNIDNPGTSGNKNVDIYYMVAPKEAAPCEASAFSHIRRITHAPNDADMKDPATGKARYGIAEYPMRDSFGDLIPEEVLFPTYPWIDREGNNLFFSTGGSTLFSYDYSTIENYQKKPVIAEEAAQGREMREWKPNPGSERYPTRCIKDAPNCAESPYNPETPDTVRGFAVLGSWTHGKTVVLDGLINNSDYGLKRGLQFQRELQLYQPSGSFDGWVRVGPGRDTGTSGSGIDNQLESYSENSEIPGVSGLTGVVDSLENLFNAYRYLRPTLPRDIVWTINNSIGSSEIAFDDYLDSRALIVSSMIAGAQYYRDPQSRYDGWAYRDGFGWDGAQDKPFKQNRPILLQNAATSDSLPVPKWGYLSKGRVEPVALGGIHGRGLWLDSSTLSYSFPRALTNQPLFISLFIDPRPINNNLKLFLTFPDGTKVLLSNSSLRITKYFESDKSTLTKDLGLTIPSQQWSHLAFAVTADNKNIDLYLNGMKKTTLALKKKVFQLKAQKANTALNLVVGSNLPTNKKGFRGWIDDFKLFSYIPTSEVICNHAYGSLHYVQTNANDAWKDLAASYTNETHRDIYNQLPSDYVNEQAIPADARFVCTTDYRDSMGLYRALLREGDGLRSVRMALLFAVPKAGGGYDDGRLSWNTPRVDFQNNSFCLSCHTANERRGLTLEALLPGSVCAMNDRRRQPMQGILFLAGSLSESQLQAINPNHASKDKIFSSSGALVTDPLTLSTKSGGNKCTYTPF